MSRKAVNGSVIVEENG